MTTRDPRSRDYPTGPTPSTASQPGPAPGDADQRQVVRRPGTPVVDEWREPTESLNLSPDEVASPALAVGTHDHDVTSVESPRAKTAPPLASPAERKREGPEIYLGRVLGSYRVLELLGKGGMGYVFRAEHVKLGRAVALKLLRDGYASRRDAVSRFFQEARTVNRVRHRNIVDVTDFVELDDTTTYIIMELLTGSSLGAWAKRGVDVTRALAVVVQICDGLAAAHEVGVVHRDLKPDNVMVMTTSDGGELAKLLDFGVAKLLNRDDEDVGFHTTAGSVIGTPAYMSPEQAGGMAVDARSDIYSLGAIMYEVFCGHPMFRGRSFGEYVRKHLTEMPAPPRQTPGGANLDPRLEAVILRCLDKDPEQRFPRISELRDALLGILATPAHTEFPEAPTEPSQASPMPPPAATPHAAHGTHAAHGAPAAPRATSKLVWLTGVIAAVGLGMLAAAWYSGRTAKPATAAPPLLAQPKPPTTAAPLPPPTAQPLTAPPPPARLVELRFESVPSGAVFAAGQTVELCRTPCAFNLDLSDGGPLDRRGFVVRRGGYADAAVVVDLTAANREFHVTLQHAPGRADPKDRRPNRRPATSRKPARDAAPPEAPPATELRVAPPGAAHAEPAPPPAKPTIDPTDTLDPFRRKP